MQCVAHAVKHAKCLFSQRATGLCTAENASRKISQTGISTNVLIIFLRNSIKEIQGINIGELEE
jgi:hypothetical protein